MTDGTPFIRIDGVSLTYSGTTADGVHAIERVDTTIGRDEFVSIIGPSGCGKTSLLKILGDLLEPSSGEVLIDGRHPADLRRAHQIGHMFQDSVLLPWRTIRQNIRLLCDVVGRRLDASTLESLAVMTGLEAFLDAYPHQLSGGMRQRAALCRALALDPTILLMDEPFGALDEITREKMNFELLRVWQERRKTVVFITHSIGEAAFLSDRVLVMAARPGRIIADVRIPLPRPRDREARYRPEMTEIVRDLHKHLVAAEAGHRDV